MVMRETTSGEAKACRQKALRHVERIQSKFNETTTDEEKFHAYLEHFQKVAAGVERFRENFRDENYTRWLNDHSTATMLYDANEEGVILMDLLRAEMEPLKSAVEGQPLSRINGTSIEFARCSSLCNEAHTDFEDTDSKYHEKILCDRAASEKPIIVRKLEAMIAMIMAHFIFIPDGLLA